jgi:ribonuclease VapC
MFVDASALVAILLGEPDADELLGRLQAAGASVTSPVAVYETVLAVMRVRAIPRLAAEQQARALLLELGVAVVPITDEIGRAALDAFDRYGKGRSHPAQLNLGDCFAYGAAVTLGVPLLYKGDDFAETDLGRAG